MKLPGAHFVAVNEEYLLMTFFGLLVVRFYFLGKISKSLKRQRPSYVTAYFTVMYSRTVFPHSSPARTV